MNFLTQYSFVFGYFFLFIFGLFIGSFLNVVADRSSKGASFIKGRSKCDSCDTTLSGKDLVPLFSYIFLKGKCRYCNTKLTWYYPFSELLTGSLFLGLAIHMRVFSANAPVDIWFSYFYLAVIFSVMIVLLLADLKYRLLPNSVIYPAIIFTVVMTVIAVAAVALTSYYAMQADPFGKYLIQVGYWRDQMMIIARGVGLTFVSSIFIALFFWFLILITKGKGMGGGDLKLALFIGLFNGFPNNIVAIVVGFVSGALYSLFMLVLRKKTMKDTIPFGPFLILGSVVAFLFGSVIRSFYIGLF